MAGHRYTAEVIWNCSGDFSTNAYSRGHVWRFDGNIEVPASASPTVVPLPNSVEAAVDPEEAFIAALSSCHMLWFLDLARQAGLSITGYADRAEGVMARVERGKWAVTQVTLNPQITLAGTALPDVQAITDLHEKAHEACFIANSVKSEIIVAPSELRLVSP